jgi:hypothetical protein
LSQKHTQFVFQSIDFSKQHVGNVLENFILFGTKEREKICFVEEKGGEIMRKCSINTANTHQNPPLVHGSRGKMLLSAREWRKE